MQSAGQDAEVVVVLGLHAWPPLLYFNTSSAWRRCHYLFGADENDPFALDMLCPRGLSEGVPDSLAGTNPGPVGPAGDTVRLHTLDARGLGGSRHRGGCPTASRCQSQNSILEGTHCSSARGTVLCPLSSHSAPALCPLSGPAI